MSNDRSDRTEQAAEELVEAARDSYRVAVDRAFEARASHVRMTRHYFEDGIGLLEDHSEANRRAMQRLAEQAEERREALQEVSRASLESYSGFLDSLSDYRSDVLQEPGKRE
ncbi:MAG: hypothetical protein H0U02_10405 [Rubrobacter sp.]|jgi:hypothetical protein|nr:hypothetical protein [Rubrobacter sp.]